MVPLLVEVTSTPTPKPPPTALLTVPGLTAAPPVSMVLVESDADEPTELMDIELLMPPLMAPPLMLLVTPSVMLPFLMAALFEELIEPTVIELLTSAPGLLEMVELDTDADEPTALMPIELPMPPVMSAGALLEPMVPVVLTEVASLVEDTDEVMPLTPPIEVCITSAGPAIAADETIKEAIVIASVCFFIGDTF